MGVALRLLLDLLQVADDPATGLHLYIVTKFGTSQRQAVSRIVSFSFLVIFFRSSVCVFFF